MKNNPEISIGKSALDPKWPTEEEQQAYWQHKEDNEQLSRTESAAQWFDAITTNQHNTKLKHNYYKT